MSKINSALLMNSSKYRMAKSNLFGAVGGAVESIQPKVNLIEGAGKRACVGDLCKERGYSSVLVLTDTVLKKLGFLDKVIEGLEKNNIRYAVYDEIAGEPTTGLCEDVTEVGRQKIGRAHV